MAGLKHAVGLRRNQLHTVIVGRERSDLRTPGANRRDRSVRTPALAQLRGFRRWTVSTLLGGPNEVASDSVVLQE